MIKKNQALFEIGIVLAIPMLLLWGYYFLGSSSDDSALLSFVVSQEETQEYGVQAKQALSALKSINMDASLFDDPVYTSLKEFHLDIDTTTSLGRTYPFTPPPAVRGLLGKPSTVTQGQ